MGPEQWTAVDRFISDLLVPEDEALIEATRDSEAAGLPSISVTANVGKLLHIVARLQGARSILELGTLGGYSTIWLARALPDDGRLITLEFDPKHAEIARRNMARAGVASKVELRLGPAIETLPQLECEGRGPFDFVFIDADKPSTADYFRWALRLARRGSLIVVDNVVRKGAVTDPASTDPSVQGVRRFYDAVVTEPRVTSTVIQTVGRKGYDGLAFALVTV
jgi:predicted O-methyltransferase YrrM